MKEPFSTVTNLAYAVAGGFVIATGGWLAAPFAVSLVLLAVASWGYHATLDGHWQTRDEQAMYLALCCLAALLASRINPGHALLYIPTGIALGVLIAREWARVDSHVMVPILAAVCAVHLIVTDWRRAAVLGVVALASVGVRSLGERGGPKHGLTDYLHAAWHIGSGTVLAFAGMP